jgi:plastocyanin
MPVGPAHKENQAMTSLEGSGSKLTTWQAALTGGAILALLAVPVAPRAQGLTPSTPQQQLAAVEAAEVSIKNFQFVPAALTIPAGTTVTWTNRDDDAHTVKSADRLFSSTGLDPGQAFSYTFTTPGTYKYYCAIHTHMTATVIVK